MMIFYVLTWILFSLFMAAEYWALHHPGLHSFLVAWQKAGYLPAEFSLKTDAGRPLSLWLGWIGLGLMLLMNVYSMRKRFEFMRGLGKLKSWLDFHVFCGLLGPTFILFHSDFKVRGLVAISFWSMIVSFASGIVGRYFYMQLLSQRSDLVNFEKSVIRRLDQLLEKSKVTITPELRQKQFALALRYAEVPLAEEEAGFFSAFYSSVVGGLKMTFGSIPVGMGWPKASEGLLHAFVIVRRKTVFLESFQRLMGYWHAFHFPFAVFMYLAAAIHVAAALTFGV